jgi:hypothetical protein
MHRMGIEVAVLTCCTAERGALKVTAGRPILATFLATGNTNSQTFTSEDEVLRADLLHRARRGPRRPLRLRRPCQLGLSRPHREQDPRSLRPEGCPLKSAASWSALTALVRSSPAGPRRTTSTDYGTPTSRTSAACMHFYCECVARVKAPVALRPSHARRRRELRARSFLEHGHEHDVLRRVRTRGRCHRRARGQGRRRRAHRAWTLYAHDAPVDRGGAGRAGPQAGALASALTPGPAAPRGGRAARGSAQDHTDRTAILRFGVGPGEGCDAEAPQIFVGLRLQLIRAVTVNTY